MRPKIMDLIIQIAEQQQKPLAPLTDELPLLESGLDSLCIAILVARLDDQFGLDPFSDIDDIDFPATIGAFIRLYDHAAG
jgi:acyl carrier protein